MCVVFTDDLHHSNFVTTYTHTLFIYLSLSRFVFLSLSTYLSTYPCVCTCVVASMPLCPYTGTLIPHRWHHREFKRHDNRWLTCIATPYQRRCVYCHGESAKHPRSIHDCCAAVLLCTVMLYQVVVLFFHHLNIKPHINCYYGRFHTFACETGAGCFSRALVWRHINFS